MQVEKIGFVVVETCEDFEQALALHVGEHLPLGGVLAWREGREPVFVFNTRTDAKEAIQRSEHYRLAFAIDSPVKEFCRIVPLERSAEEEENGQLV